MFCCLSTIFGCVRSVEVHLIKTKLLACIFTQSWILKISKTFSLLSYLLLFLTLTLALLYEVTLNLRVE